MGKIELVGVEKSFGKVDVISDVNLTIDDGSFVVFVGPSGCGKSTLLRLIAGLEDATAGKILIDGVDVVDTPPAKRGLSMVFQSYALYPHMSVRKNIGFGLRMAGRPKGEIDEKVDAAAKILNLTQYLDRRPGQLSGGQRQRVAIGRAIVREPKAFLFDEPLSNLDAALRVQMRLEIAKLQDTLGTTAIYVTHDQVEAMTMADRIVVLNAGRIEQVGSPLELYNRPANLFVAGFIGSPPMNTLEGSVADGAVVTATGKVPAAGFAPRPSVVFGFRPEDARIVDPAEADLRGSVYACELTGNETIVTVQMGKAQTVVKMDKNYDVAADTPVGVTVDRAKLCLFDPASGERIRAA